VEYRQRQYDNQGQGQGPGTHKMGVSQVHRLGRTGAGRAEGELAQEEEERCRDP
jgi:hypothetical protein